MNLDVVHRSLGQCTYALGNAQGLKAVHRAVHRGLAQCTEAQSSAQRLRAGAQRLKAGSAQRLGAVHIKIL